MKLKEKVGSVPDVRLKRIHVLILPNWHSRVPFLLWYTCNRAHRSALLVSGPRRVK